MEAHVRQADTRLASAVQPDGANTLGRRVAFAREVHLDVPLVVRLEGTNVEKGKQIMADSGLPIISADDLGDAAEKIVKAVKEAA